jgi:hypothetical protein
MNCLVNPCGREHLIAQGKYSPALSEDTYSMRKYGDISPLVIQSGNFA